MDADELAEEMRAVHLRGENRQRPTRDLDEMDVIICPLCDDGVMRDEFGDHWRDEHQ